MKNNIENNPDILKNNIDGKLNKLADFMKNNFLLGEKIRNYGELEKYKKEKQKFIAGIEKELDINNNIS